MSLRGLAPLWALVLVGALLALGSTGYAAQSTAGHPAPVASAASHEQKAAEVRLRDTVVFEIRVGRGAQLARDRASKASKALADAIQLPAHDVRVATSEDAAVIYVGTTPVVQLYPEDAQAAGDTTLAVHADATASKLRQAIQAETRRKAVADTVFSISLVVFLGLMTLYLLRKSGEIEQRLLKRLEEHPERVAALRVASFELVGQGSARLMLAVLLTTSKWVLRGAVIYGYLVVVTTLFEPTHSYAEKLTRWAIAPVSALVTRVAESLPLVFLVLCAAAVVALLLRLSSLFFSSVAKGETETHWLRRDMAEALNGLSGVAIVVLALVFAAPVVTGQSDGAFAKVGTYLLFALALGAAPILASAGLGALLVVRRHVRSGDRIQVGAASGIVRHFGLIDLVLKDDRGNVVRIPYVATLLSPLRIASDQQVSVTLTVDSSASPLETLGILRRAAQRSFEGASVTLLALEPGGARYELSLPEEAVNAREKLLVEASEALREAGIPLAGAARAAGEKL